MFRRHINHWPKIFTAAFVTMLGLLLFKFVPMSIWGNEILFDASAHIASSIFVLYVLWFFIDQNKHWHTPYFIFCAMILSVISFQRISDNAHNDIGLLGGLLVGFLSIWVAERAAFTKALKF